MLGGEPDTRGLDETADVQTGDAPHPTMTEPSPAEPLAPGTHVGRYVVVDRIGAGGMGVVYRGQDPELNRRVALKLLRDGEDEPGGERRSRLLREAQALARLSHPNVVGVYDVGLFGDSVYLAMEFVEGQTLRAWLDERPRKTAEILAVMIGAGEGLAAAHAKDIVHRDFKPDNVMVDADGRVRVVDFGLAREPESAPGRTPPVSEDPTLDTFSALTRDGAILGTPGYMAPEQLRGQSVDRRTDGFSFCVTLWQALYGVRPFGGETPGDRLMATLEGVLAEPPSGVDVAPWLRRACTQGLAVEPEQRFADMESLLAVLRRGRSRARTLKALVAVAVVAAVGVGTLGYRWVARNQAIASCEADGASIAEVWGPTREAKFREQFVAGGIPTASDTADKTIPWLDQYAQSWTEVRTAACLGATVDGTWTPDNFERSLSCLQEREVALDALVTALSRGDASMVRRAVGAASGMTSPQTCGDSDRLARLPAMPSGQREAIGEVRAQLAQARAQFDVGAYPEGLEIGRAALQRAEALGWAPLVVRSLSIVGRLVNGAGDYDEAEATFERAYFEAMKVGLTDLAADTAERLVITVGIRQQRHDDAERWSQHAQTVRATMPDGGGTRRIDGLRNRASVRWAAGDHELALALFRQAVELREAEVGTSDPEFALTLGDMANVHLDRGETKEALALMERAIPILEAALGPRHPKVAGNLGTLAGVYFGMNDLPKARALFEQAIDIQEDVLGPQHPQLAASLQNLGIVVGEMGEPDAAKPLIERALRIRIAKLGADHPAVASTQSNLAMVHHNLGAHAKAQALHEEALKIREAALGPDHPELAYPLVGAAEAAVAQERFVEATAYAERGLALRRAAKSRPTSIGVACFVLAKALWGSGADRPRARVLAREAQAAFEGAGGGPFLDKINQWVASRE